MNDRTASGILEGPASVVASASTCEFSHESDRLLIEVYTAAAPFRTYLNRCKSGAEPLKAIGNEAVLCDGDNPEQIAIGRVREQVFVLRLKTPAPKAQLREKLKGAAEIVAGNLY